MNRLAAACGMTLQEQGQSFVAFPEPADVAELPVDALRQMQLSQQRALALTGMAQAIASGEWDLPALAEQDDETALRTL